MADKELKNVRTAFVTGVTLPVIKGLLDDLLEDGVLNDGEKDSAIKGNSIESDQARCLIDMVRKKGPKASRKMIDRLLSRDPYLHDKLGLSPGTDKAMSLQKQTDQGPLKLKNKEQKEKESYTVSFPVKRIALLIVNVVFDCKTMNRKGAEKDEENMENLLKELGYDVVKRRNLSSKDMDTAIKDFSKHSDLNMSDSVFVVIMSHGKLGKILGTKYTENKPDEFAINNIFTYLNSEHCPALHGKPKVIIIQACRGEKAGSVYVSDDAGAADNSTVHALACDGAVGEEDMDEDAFRTVHREKDFVSLLSCTPDTVSYRHPEKGSLLIQFIVEEFRNSARVDHIEELFRMVMRRFEEFDAGGRRQMPNKDRCSLTKLFYLFPEKLEQLS